MSDSSTKKLLQIEDLIDQGKYDEANQRIWDIEEKKDLGSYLWIECRLLRVFLLNRQGKFEDALHITDNITTAIQNTSNLQKLEFYIARATTLWRLGRLDEGLDMIDKGEQFIKKLSVDKSIDFLELAYKQTELVNRKATIYIQKGNLDQAFIYFQQCLTILRSIDIKQGWGIALLNLGIVLSLKGDLIQSLDYFERSLAHFERIKNEQNSAIALRKMGEIYLLKGDIMSALNYFRQSLTINEKFGNQQEAASCLNNIGLVYREKGVLPLAIEYFEKCLGIRKEIGNKIDISETLFHLISLTVEKKSSRQAEQYFEELKRIAEKETTIKIIYDRAAIAEALILKSSVRLRHHARAEELLEKVVNAGIADQELNVLAMLHLSELLLFELKSSGEKEVLQDVKSLLNRILEIAKQQYSPLLLIETYLLNSKLALLDWDLEAAQRSLNQAKLAAETRGLHRLVLKLQNEQENLQEQINIWQFFIERNIPIHKQLEALQIDKQIFRIIRKRLNLVEEDTLEYAKTAQRLVDEWEKKE